MEHSEKTFLLPKAIFWGGLICGILDISAAFLDVRIFYNMGPVRLLQAVAAAVLGPAAVDGGLPAAALGLAMHFTVAFSAATVFYLASRRWPVLVRWAVPCGILYGALVFIVMARGVIPLTIQFKSLYLPNVARTLPKLRWQQLVIHCVCVGPPIALAARRFSSRA